MSGAHEAFKALGPINWDDVAQEQLDSFLKDTFRDAQCIVDSIPESSSHPAGQPRSVANTNPPSLSDEALTKRAAELRKQWQEVKINARENPLGLDIYKLAAKDKKGAWFARRSVHDGIAFEKWKLGMERELDESLKVQGKPGDGSIRGIGADKKVEDQTVPGRGKIQVYQLSAQFPGPTSPRDFITLLMSSDSVIDAPGTPRHFMLVSKPCIHPECPPRQGFIRGQYESVEFIREIKVEKPLRKTRSSVDLPSDEATASKRKAADNIGREATIRSARQATDSSSTKEETGRKRGKTIGSADVSGDGREEDENYETKIEWIMVTRSDPGGSVPRFLIEKGTPPGIAGDANKFINWMSSKSFDDLAEPNNREAESEQELPRPEKAAPENSTSTDSTPTIPNRPSAPRPPAAKQREESEGDPGPAGVYGMLANALNAAASVAASRIPNPFGLARSEDTDSSDLSQPQSQEDDQSSIHSFHSLEAEGIDENDNASQKPEDSSTQITPSITNGGAESTVSSESLATRSATPSHHEKELKKLQERKRKTEEKLRRAQERALAKRDSAEASQQRDEAALQKLREKHEREMVKQHDKYQRELAKLEAKRAEEQKKAEARRRKTIEREEKANLAMELDKVRAERDIARKQIDILTERVCELQTQNTMLVARLGREGIVVDSQGSVSGNGNELGSGPSQGIKRSVTDQMTDRDARRASTLRS